MLYDDKGEVVTTSDPHAASNTINKTHNKLQQTFFTEIGPGSPVHVWRGGIARFPQTEVWDSSFLY